MRTASRVGTGPNDLRWDARNADHPASKARTVRGGSRFHLLIVVMSAALALGAGLGFGGVGTRNSSAAVPGGDLPASSDMVITLENAGPSPITEAALGFDIPPIDPGQTLDGMIGDPGPPYDLGELQFGGSPVSRTNPLPPGGVACVGPLPELVPGTYVEFEEIEWFGNGFGGAFYLAIEVDASTLPFDWPHPAVPGGQLVGTWRFLSAAPPECEPSPSGDPGGTEGVDQGDVPVTDTDLGGNDERTAVPSSGPGAALALGPIGLVVTMAVVSSIAAFLVRHRRRKGPDPPGAAR